MDKKKNIIAAKKYYKYVESVDINAYVEQEYLDVLAEPVFFGEELPSDDTGFRIIESEAPDFIDIHTFIKKV